MNIVIEIGIFLIRIKLLSIIKINIISQLKLLLKN